MTRTYTSSTIVTAQQLIATALQEASLPEQVLISQVGNCSKQSVVPSLNFSQGSVHAICINASASNLTSRVVVALEGESAAVELPARFADEELAVVITAYSDSVSGTSEDGVHLLVPPVGVRIIEITSGEERSGQFPFDLRVRVTDSSNDSMVCAFWNEAIGKWSTEGLTNHFESDGSLWCLTSHLTLFAAIALPFDELGGSIVCANLAVLSEEGLKLIFRGTWAQRPAACVLWSLSTILLLLLVLASSYDYHLLHRVELWEDERFLIFGADESECWLCAISRDIFETFVLDVLGVGKHADKLKVVKFAAGAKGAKDDDHGVESHHLDGANHGDHGVGSEHSVRSHRVQHFHGPRARHRCCCCCRKSSKFLKKQLAAGARYACLLIMSHDLGTSVSDIKHHLSSETTASSNVEDEVARMSSLTSDCSDLRGTQQLRGQKTQHTQLRQRTQHTQIAPSILSSNATSAVSNRQTVCPYIADTLILKHSSALDKLQTTRCLCWPRLLVPMFVAQHPAYDVFNVTIFTTSSMQAVTVAASLLGPAMLAALFFSTSGEALSLRGASECAVSGARSFWRDVAVGFVSWFVSSLPLLILGSLIKRSFVYRREWSAARKWRWLMWWKCQDFFVYYTLLAYCIFCVVYVAAFLANVNEDDESMWITAFVTALIEDFVLTPLLIAVMLLLILLCVRCTSPTLLVDILNSLRLSEDHKAVFTNVVTVDITITMNHVDFDMLTTDESLNQKVVAAIKRGVRAGLPWNFTNKDIQVMLSEGSVIAAVSVRPKLDKAEKLWQRMCDKERDVHDAVVKHVLAVPKLYASVVDGKTVADISFTSTAPILREDEGLRASATRTLFLQEDQDQGIDQDQVDCMLDSAVAEFCITESSFMEQGVPPREYTDGSLIVPISWDGQEFTIASI